MKRTILLIFILLMSSSVLSQNVSQVTDDFNDNSYNTSAWDTVQIGASVYSFITESGSSLGTRAGNYNNQAGWTVFGTNNSLNSNCLKLTTKIKNYPYQENFWGWGYCFWSDNVWNPSGSYINNGLCLHHSNSGDTIRLYEVINGSSTTKYQINNVDDSTTTYRDFNSTIFLNRSSATYMNKLEWGDDTYYVPLGSYDSLLQGGVLSGNTGFNKVSFLINPIGHGVYYDYINLVSTTNDCYKSLNISFYDEETNNLLNGLNVSIEFIGIDESFSTSTTTGNYFKQASQISSSELIIKYSAEGYHPRLYYLNSINLIDENLDLFLLNQSVGSNVSVQLYDQAGDYLINTYVKSLRYYLDCNCFKTVELVKSNFEGKTNLFMELNNPFYKIVIQPNETSTYYNTEQFIPDSTTLNFIVPVGIIDPTENQQVINQISYTFTFNNASNTFTSTFNDGSNQVTQACIKVYKNKIMSNNLFNSSCTSSTSGTVNVGVTAVNGTTYEGKLYFTFNNEEHHAETLFKNYFLGKEVFGNSGVFVVILLLIVVGFTAVWNPNVSIVLFTFGLVTSTVLGLVSIGTTAIMGIVGVAVVMLLLNKS